LKTHGTELSTRPQPFAEGRFLLEEERVAEGPNCAERTNGSSAHAREERVAEGPIANLLKLSMT